MAAIMYGTRYYHAAGDADGLPLKKLWHETRYSNDEWANHVYIQLYGKNTEFRVGQTVTVKTPTDTFIGQIWHIYNSTEVYNIYVHPSSKPSSEITDATYGKVWLGTEVRSALEPLPTETVQTPLISVAPVVSEPIVATTVISEPLVSKLVASTPVVLSPIVSEPEVTEPIVAQTVATVPTVSSPVVLAPIDPEPEISSPIVSSAVVATPILTSPIVSETVNTSPVTIVSVASEPVISASPSLDPVTVSPVTVKEGQTVLQAIAESDETKNAEIAENVENVATKSSATSTIQKIKPIAIILLVVGAILVWKLKNNKK